MTPRRRPGWTVSLRTSAKIAEAPLTVTRPGSSSATTGQPTPAFTGTAPPEAQADA
jgi:hypothetical protein